MPFAARAQGFSIAVFGFGNALIPTLDAERLAAAQVIYELAKVVIAASASMAAVSVLVTTRVPVLGAMTMALPTVAVISPAALATLASN